MKLWGKIKMKIALYNAKVYVERERFVEAVLVEDRKIKAIGTNEEILATTDIDEKIDCEGKTVIPGLNDSHMHIFNFGERMCQVKIGDCESIDEMIDRCKKYIERNGGIIMTAKEYLKSISQLDDEIKRKRQRCRTLRDVAMNTSIKYLGDAVQQTRDNNPLEKILAKVIDLERQIENEESRLVDLKAEVWEQLDKLEDETQKRILWLRYAENKTWKMIAKDICFSERYIRKLHAKGLIKLEELLKK